MIDNAVSTLAHQAIDATSDRLHDTTERIQGVTQTSKPRKSHKLLRALLLSLAVAAIGAGVAMFLQRRTETRDVAPDAFGDAAEREQRARDFASIP